MSLAELITQYESVCNDNGTDKGTSHSYVETYVELLTPRKNTVQNVLEIGVYSGAFTTILAKFFENAHIDGVDITLRNVRFGKDHPRVHYHEMDGTSPLTAEQLNRQYDLIIDDASHLPHHQIDTFAIFAKYLTPGGVYIIEDIHGDFAEHVKEKTADLAFKYGLRMEWVDLRTVKGRFDDILAIFYRD